MSSFTPESPTYSESVSEDTTGNVEDLFQMLSTLTKPLKYYESVHNNTRGLVDIWFQSLEGGREILRSSLKPSQESDKKKMEFGFEHQVCIQYEPEPRFHHRGKKHNKGMKKRTTICQQVTAPSEDGAHIRYRVTDIIRGSGPDAREPFNIERRPEWTKHAGYKEKRATWKLSALMPSGNRVEEFIPDIFVLISITLALVSVLKIRKFRKSLLG